jgi:hypothetical protein
MGAKERNVPGAERRFGELLWPAEAATFVPFASALREPFHVHAEQKRAAVFSGFILAGSTRARAKPAQWQGKLFAHEADSATAFRFCCVLMAPAPVKLP